MALVPHHSPLVVVFSNALAVKIAVSIPEAVFEAAERLAERRRCSRSSLYTEALRRLLAHEDSQEVAARLDAVFSDESSDIAPGLLEPQRRAIAERW